MALLLLVNVLALVAHIFRLPTFLTAFGVILATPLAAFLFGFVFSVPLNIFTHVILLLGICIGAIYLFSPGRREKIGIQKDMLSELMPVILFNLVFVISLIACLSWPDFFPNGERLRDYALVAALIRDPVTAAEPWMSGYQVNYYLYWYRFASFLSSILVLDTWNTYHQLISFAIAFYVAAVANSLRITFGMGALLSAIVAIFIGFGSNVSGLINGITGDSNWWGPSRVVAGAINEFPAWSFILGDAHPHYLNLGLFPFFVSFVSLLYIRYNLTIKLLPVLALGIFGSAICYYSNAWEMPLWLLFGAILTCSTDWVGSFYAGRKQGLDLVIRLIIDLIILILVAGIIFYGSMGILGADAKLAGLLVIVACSAYGLYVTRLSPGISINRRIIITGLFLIGLLGVYLGTKNLLPDNPPITLVRPPVISTTMRELALHWGFAISLLAIGLILSFGSWAERLFFLITVAFAALFYEAEMLIFCLLVIGLCRVLLSPDPLRSPICSSMLMLSLIGLILPELVYFNDAYGGEIERMNTIFKVYSFLWYPIHAVGFWLFLGSIRSVTHNLSARMDKTAIKVGLGAISVVFLLSGLTFTQHAASLRASEFSDKNAEGLSLAERNFPGAADTIRFLRKEHNLIVLEAQGNAYDWTSFVSTLASQQGYLGWANHMNLLIRDYAEVSRREKVTEAFYTTPRCAEKLEIMRNEKIDAAILGPLERKKYGELVYDNFACLEPLFSADEFKVFGKK